MEPTVMLELDEPTDEEIEKYAEWLGLDTKKDKELMYLAKEGLTAELPPGWITCKDEDGDIFYYCQAQEKSSWDHPSDEHYKKLAHTLKTQKEERLAKQAEVEKNKKKTKTKTLKPDPIQQPKAEKTQSTNKTSSTSSTKKKKLKPVQKTSNPVLEALSPAKVAKPKKKLLTKSLENSPKPEKEVKEQKTPITSTKKQERKKLSPSQMLLKGTGMDDEIQRSATDSPQSTTSTVPSISPTDIEGMQDTLSKLTTEETKMHESLSLLKRKKYAAQKSVEELNKMHSKSKKQIESLQRTKDTYLKSIQMLRDQEQTLNGQISKLVKNGETKQKEIETNLSTLRDQKKTLKQQVNETQQALTSLTTHLESEETSMNTKMKHLNGEYDDLKERVNALREKENRLQNANYHEKLDDLQSEYNKLSKDNQHLANQVESQRGLLRNLVEKEQRLRSSIHNLEDTKTVEQDNLSRLQTDKTQVMESIATQEDRLTRLKKEMASSESDKLQVMSEKKTLTRNVASLQEDKETLEQQLQLLKDELSELQTLTAETKPVIQATVADTQEHQTMRVSLETLRMEHQDLLATNQKVRAKLDEASKDLQQVNQEHHDLSNNFALKRNMYEREATKLDAANKEAKDHLERLREQRQSLQYELKTLANDVATFKKKSTQEPLKRKPVAQVAVSVQTDSPTPPPPSSPISQMKASPIQAWSSPPRATKSMDGVDLSLLQTFVNEQQQHILTRKSQLKAARDEWRSDRDRGVSHEVLRVVREHLEQEAKSVNRDIHIYSQLSSLLMVVPSLSLGKSKQLGSTSHLSTPHVSIMSGPPLSHNELSHASSSSGSSSSRSSSTSSNDSPPATARRRPRIASHRHRHSDDSADAAAVSDDTQLLLDVLSQKLRGRRSSSSRRTRQQHHHKSPPPSSNPRHQHHPHHDTTEFEDASSPRTKWNNFFNAAAPPSSFPASQPLPSANARIWEIQSTLDRLSMARTEERAKFDAHSRWLRQFRKQIDIFSLPPK